MGKTVAFIGETAKNMAGYNTDRYKDFVKQLERQILAHISSGYNTFLTDGSQGTGQLAFWATHNAKKSNPEIRIGIISPFKDRDKAWHNTGLFSKEQYAKMIELADFVTQLNPSYNTSSRKLAAKAFLDCNIYAVNNADAVIAVYHTDKTTDDSITRKCIRHACSIGIPVTGIAFDEGANKNILPYSVTLLNP